MYKYLKDISQDKEQTIIFSKIVVVGDKGVGKKTLIKKLTGNDNLLNDLFINPFLPAKKSDSFIQPTDFIFKKLLNNKEKQVSFCFWNFPKK